MVQRLLRHPEPTCNRCERDRARPTLAHDCLGNLEDLAFGTLALLHDPRGGGFLDIF